MYTVTLISSPCVDKHAQMQFFFSMLMQVQTLTDTCVNFCAYSFIFVHLYRHIPMLRPLECEWV